MTQPFTELVDLFPRLAATGCRDEARLAVSGRDPTLLQQVRAASATRPADVEQTLTLWARNHEHITGFGELERAIGSVAARAQLSLELRTAWAELFEEPQLSESVEGTVDLRHRSWVLISDRSSAADLGPIALGRGTALSTEDFARCFAIGQVSTFEKPLACTIDLDLVPLHYAWKTWSKLDGDEGDRIGVILNVAAEPDHPVRGHWTGDIKGRSPAESYEWQGEIVVAPGLQIRVERHDELSANLGRLVRVIARPV